MTDNYSKYLILTVFLIIFSSSILYAEEYFPLFDFNSNENNSKYEWKDFTDQVMGGKSEGSSSLRQEDGEFFNRLSGEVSLENDGGFIQTRLILASGFSSFNADDYNGIQLEIRGKDSGYYLFIRTSGTVFPWLYYKAPVPLNEDWQTIKIPWSKVEKGDYGSMKDFDPSKLKNIAIVAFGKGFDAEVDLKKIGLYKD